MKKNVKGWNKILSHAEFAFNRTPSKATDFSPFQMVYGSNPCTPLDLTPISSTIRVKEIQKLHANVRARIEKFNEQNKMQADKHRKDIQFKPRDLVWIHLRKERFPSKRRSKLLPRSDGPFESPREDQP